jgi:hypothetical protein
MLVQVREIIGYAIAERRDQVIAIEPSQVMQRQSHFHPIQFWSLNSYL